MLLPPRLALLCALLGGLLAAPTVAARPGPHRQATEREAKAEGKASASEKGGADRSPSPRAKRSAHDEATAGHRTKAEAARPDKRPEHKPRKDTGKSLGAPNHGKLDGGVLLHGSKTLHRTKGSRAFGLLQLVHALEHAANAVEHKTKGPPMLVGDLSTREGGFLSAHKSHQSGRDADIAFYAVTTKGKPVALNRFVAFDGAGRAKDGTRVQFDDARNWAMVEDLLQSAEVTVRYLFVTNELRERLLGYAAKKKVSRELLTRAAAAMMSPEDADPHDDHVHLRISCPEAQKGTCIEESIPVYSGRGAPEDAGAGVRPSAEPAEAEPPTSGDSRPGVEAPPAAGASPLEPGAAGPRPVQPGAVAPSPTAPAAGAGSGMVLRIVKPQAP